MLAPPLINRAKDLGPQTFDWWPDWRGQECAIVASGPSVKNEPLDLLRGRMRVIAVNESWQLVPWADMLYGCDGRWWKLRNYVPEFKGLKLTFDSHIVAARPEIKKIEIHSQTHADEIKVDKPGVIGSGGNSGFQAINIGTQLGVIKILLLGFDMRLNVETHWHGRHPPPLSNPCELSNFPRWIRSLDGSAKRLCDLGVRVINCSPVSALRNFEVMPLAEALSLPPATPALPCRALPSRALPSPTAPRPALPGT